MPLDRFHPAVSAWFEKHFVQPTEPQALAWPAIKDHQHTLIAAPTGSGKTLSYVLPLLQQFRYKPEADNRHIKTLVLVPTRELAVQAHSKWM